MWKHVVIDNFLTNEHFEFIKNTYAGGRVKILANERGVKVSERTPDFSDKITNEFIEELHKTYTPRLLKILEELAPEKIKYYKHTRFIFVKTPKDVLYPMHTDTSDKLLSVVIYLKPEKNSGTILYENGNGDGPIEIEWKQNRAFIFSRETNETWHSFKGDGVNDRYTLLINLVNRKGGIIRKNKVKNEQYLKNFKSKKIQTKNILKTNKF